MKRSLQLAALFIITGTLASACASNGGEDVSSDEAAVRTGGTVVDSDGRVVLPNWATESELAAERTAEPPAEPLTREAPPSSYRIPAEYEPVSTVIMTWAGHSPVLSGISVAAAAAGADVWMVGGPSSIPNVPAARYRAMSWGYDSVWSRDYGPVGIDESSNTLGIVDTTYRHYAVRTNDDAMSCKIAGAFGANCHQTRLILDGGNYMTDGKGNVFLTSRVYDWNSSMSRAEVDDQLRTYLGAKTIHILDYAKSANGQPADGTGHMDMMAKLIAECKVVVVQTTNEPFKTVTDKAAAYFANTECAPGRTYEVTRVRGWLNGRTWYTYSNSLMVNKTVILPFYNDSARNEEAVAAYKAALPDYNVVGVLSESTIVQGGSIHCITKEIPSLPAAPPVDPTPSEPTTPPTR